MGVRSLLVQTEGPDTDSDGLPDAWETQFGLDPSSATGFDGANGDPDTDGRTNQQEYLAGSHPRGFVTRYFAEGAATAFFDTRFALVNPGTAAANTLLRFLKADGTTVTHAVRLNGLTRTTISPKALEGMAAAEFSTVIESDQELVADRTMSWNASGYGSHAEAGIAAPSTTWYLAEGATHSGFDLFYLVQNANDQPANVHVKYLLPSGAPIEKDYTVAPRSRFNVWVDAEDDRLSSVDVSAVITTDRPTIVERAMYLSSRGQTFDAGHESASVTAPATEWFLAEGATGSFFDLFVLIANPSSTTAQVEATFLLPSGQTIIKNYPVAANSRFNIWVDTEDPKLASTAVSTIIKSTNGVPIIVERSMWWPGPTAASWQEAHNSPGSTSTGTRWTLAEGEAGGARATETYILVANTSAFAGSVKVRLLFEDGTAAEKTFPIGANSRFNVNAAADFPSSVGRRFGALVESLGSPAARIIVERAMYSNAGGSMWAAGTNALASPAEIDVGPYAGSYPAPTMVSYVEGGTTVSLNAFPGQVLVFFKTGTAVVEAKALIIGLGGTILESDTNAGYYFVQIPVASTSAFIAALRADSRVVAAMPHMYGVFGSDSVTLLDGCTATGHWVKVQAALVKDGGVSSKCRETGIPAPGGGEYVSLGLIVRELLNEVKEKPNGPILINLSSHGGGRFRLDGFAADWAFQGAGTRGDMQYEWLQFTKGILLAIASQDQATRERIVVTMCAGNNHMPIANLVAQLREDPRLAPVLKDNLVFVSTTMMSAPSQAGANYGVDDDIVVYDNKMAADGTSYAAPALMALVQNIMKTTGVNAKTALLAIKQAAKDNATRTVIPSVAIAKATALIPNCGHTFDYCLTNLIAKNNTCIGTSLQILACINANEQWFTACMKVCESP
jgi:hypothetical protein